MLPFAEWLQGLGLPVNEKFYLSARTENIRACAMRGAVQPLRRALKVEKTLDDSLYETAKFLAWHTVLWYGQSKAIPALQAFGLPPRTCSLLYSAIMGADIACLRWLQQTFGFALKDGLVCDAARLAASDARRIVSLYWLQELGISIAHCLEQRVLVTAVRRSNIPALLWLEELGITRRDYDNRAVRALARADPECLAWLDKIEAKTG